MGLVEAVKYREAVSVSENPYTPDTRILSEPALGYVIEPVIFNPDLPGQIVLTTNECTSETAPRIIPSGYRLTGDTVFVWRDQGLTVLSLGIEPEAI
jgi:hypothetical protein